VFTAKLLKSVSRHTDTGHRLSSEHPYRYVNSDAALRDIKPGL